jgi:hypothetical protein
MANGATNSALSRDAISVLFFVDSIRFALCKPTGHTRFASLDIRTNPA